MGQERVGDLAEPSPGLVVLVCDRLVRAIAARHHQSATELREQEMVERRVRQHHPEPRRLGRDRRRDRSIGTPPDEHDRPLARVEESCLVLVEVCQPLGLVGHHRERLVLAELARAQPGDRGLVGGVAGEVIAAEPLDGEDRPFVQELGSRPRSEA